MLDSWPGYRSVPVLTKVAKPKTVCKASLLSLTVGQSRHGKKTMCLENGQQGKILSQAPTMSSTMLLYL
jgi:hypothetical protein